MQLSNEQFEALLNERRDESHALHVRLCEVLATQEVGLCVTALVGTIDKIASDLKEDGAVAHLQGVRGMVSLLLHAIEQKLEGETEGANERQ